MIRHLADKYIYEESEPEERWIDKPLDRKEMEAVKTFYQFTDRYGKYPLRNTLVGFSDEDAEIQLKKLLTRKEVWRSFERVWKIFDKRFQRIWPREKGALEIWKKRFEDEKELRGEEIEGVLERFFDEKPEEERINFYLVMSLREASKEEIDRKKVMFEIPPEAPAGRVFSLVWHELVHSLFSDVIDVLVSVYLKENKLEPEILEMGYGGDPKVFLREGVVSSLFDAHGYLAQKYFPFEEKVAEGKVKTAEGATEYIARAIQENAKDYIENSNAIDDTYLALIHSRYDRYLID